MERLSVEERGKYVRDISSLSIAGLALRALLLLNGLVDPSSLRLGGRGRGSFRDLTTPVPHRFKSHKALFLPSYCPSSSY